MVPHARNQVAQIQAAVNNRVRGEIREDRSRDSVAKHERWCTHDIEERLTGSICGSSSTSSSDWQATAHDIPYNARGQRVLREAGDDGGSEAVETPFTYDPDTFRLIRLQTERLTDNEVLQHIRWVHDAAGNVRIN